MKEIDKTGQSQLTEFKEAPVKISPYLLKDEKRYVTAWHGMKVIEYTQEKAEEIIVTIINTAYAELGQKIGGGTKLERMEFLLTTARLLINDIRYYTPALTIEDLKLATELGIRKHFGEYMGFNVITLHNFIESYLCSKEREDAIRKQKRFIEEQLPKPPMGEEEKDRLRVECIRACYKHFKNNGFLIDCGAVNYKFLTERGEINLSLDEKIAIYDQAKLQIDAEAMQKPVSFAEMLQNMRSQFEDLTGYQIRSREIVLKQYYSNITEEKLEEVIKKYLDEKRHGW